jgi:hypothetical protein
MATKANLVIDQGSTFSATLNLTDEFGNPLSLNGYTVRSQMRKWYTSLTAIDFNVTIDYLDGTITLELDDSITDSLTPGRYVYDVELTETSTHAISRVVEGIVTVTPNVTR